MPFFAKIEGLLLNSDLSFNARDPWPARWALKEHIYTDCDYALKRSTQWKGLVIMYLV